MNLFLYQYFSFSLSLYDKVINQNMVLTHQEYNNIYYCQFHVLFGCLQVRYLLTEFLGVLEFHCEKSILSQISVTVALPPNFLSILIICSYCVIKIFPCF